MKSVVFGCGDIGRRTVKWLLSSGVDAENVYAYVNTSKSAELCARMKVIALTVDLDKTIRDVSLCHEADLYYTVPPQKSGDLDQRSRALLENWQDNKITPKKVVLISTTGVYGDCDGQWVDESTPINPHSARAKRRCDSEEVWLKWGRSNKVPVIVLRVPGIYSFSRLPRQRLIKRTPVVNPQECGFTNRIHADDLAQVCVKAMELGVGGEVFNVTDGTPGKISEYLQAAAHVLGMEPLPQISMREAHKVLSAGMLSYLGESRKISNKKMLEDLDVVLNFPDMLQGIKA